MSGERVNKKRRDAGEGDVLANALSFEKEKNKILLDQVISLEDALVNRQMTEFDAVISDDTRDFWREQLLSNREKAEVALGELARLGGTGEMAEGGKLKTEDGDTRRPLHNRQTARPVRPGADGSASTSSGLAEGQAVKIRNRAHELSKTEGIPFSTAFRRAEREVGEA